MHNNTLYLFLCLLIFIPWHTYGYTHIRDIDINSGNNKIIWNKENSPYILDEYIDIPIGVELIIDKGVDVMVASSTLLDLSSGIYVGGKLSIHGSNIYPVKLYDVGNIFISSSSLNITNTLFKNTNIESVSGSINISSSTFLDNIKSIIAKKSNINIYGSNFINNDIAIESNKYIKVFQVKNDIENKGFGIGGEGNALGFDLEQNIINIKDTNFEGNRLSIVNNTINTVYASYNWWGSNTDPKDQFVGDIIYSPWKDKKIENEIEETQILCCSSVLFIPGLEASRLYTDKKNMIGTSTNNLWEPNSNYDVEKLVFNKNIETKNPVYTNDIIDKAYGVSGVYHNMIAMLNGMVAEKKINEWLPFAYDWRYSVSDIVLKPTKYKLSNKTLIEQAIDLAKRSKTGKISIIAHSNGGLVAKELGNELRKINKEDIVDNVIMVAVPELGTPESILGILHGIGQSLIGRLLPSESIARTLALTIPGSYGLIPSYEFFNKFINPVISFYGQKFNGINFKNYDSEITNYTTLSDFMLGNKDDRKQPKESDTYYPSIISKAILDIAQKFHNDIDSYEFPSFTKVISIIGWGNETTKSIGYSNNKISIERINKGDGTVLAGSAGNIKGINVYLNQNQIKKDKQKEIKHANILESDSVLNIVANVIEKTKNKDIKDKDKLDFNLPKYTSYEEPDIRQFDNVNTLEIYIYSPVDIDIYDDRGGHLGIVPNKVPGKWYGVPIIEDTIGSPVQILGSFKNIILPGDRKYNLVLKGTGVGLFTMDIKKYVGNMVLVSSSTYPYLPVTPLLNATTSISSLDINPILNMDTDGDGITDKKIQPNKPFDPDLLFDNMNTMIKKLKLTKKLQDNYMKRIDKIKKKIDKKDINKKNTEKKDRQDFAEFVKRLEFDKGDENSGGNEHNKRHDDNDDEQDEEEESFFVARFDIKKMTKKDKDRYVSEIERIVTAMEGYEMD